METVDIVIGVVCTLIAERHRPGKFAKIKTSMLLSVFFFMIGCRGFFDRGFEVFTKERVFLNLHITGYVFVTMFIIVWLGELWMERREKKKKRVASA